MNVTVPPALAGERLDRAVAMLTGRSRTEVSALVAAGAVRLAGRPVTARSHRLVGGETLEVELPDPAAEPVVEPDPGVDVEVAYADDHVIVVDKAAGVVVHPGSGTTEPTLAAGLLHRFPELAALGEPTRPGIVHRLDAGTSGLLVVARSETARLSLMEQLRAREVERVYASLVWGHPEAPRGVVDAPIGRSARDRTRMAVVTDGRPARTRYEVDATFTEPADTAAVTCRLETGRTHQIRVHLASIGHPVVGDDRYGGDRPAIPLSRPYLHARRLAFVHPATGERVEFESPLPPDLATVDALLR